MIYYGYIPKITYNPATGVYSWVIINSPDEIRGYVKCPDMLRKSVIANIELYIADKIVKNPNRNPHNKLEDFVLAYYGPLLTCVSQAASLLNSRPEILYRYWDIYTEVPRKLEERLETASYIAEVQNLRQTEKLAATAL